jgi:hypothetical protein
MIYLYAVAAGASDLLAGRFALRRLAITVAVVLHEIPQGMASAHSPGAG